MVLAVVFMVSSVAPVASMQSNKPLKEMSDLFQSLMPAHVTRNGVTPAVYAREVLAKGTDTVAIQVAREFYSALFVNVLAFYAGSTTGAESKAWGTLRDYVAQYIMNNDFLQNKVAGAVLAKVNAWSVTFDKDGGVTGADKAELYQFVQEFPMLLHVIVDGDASRLRPEQLKLIEISAQNVVAHKSELAKPAASTAPTVTPGVAAPVAMPGMPQAPALSAGQSMMPGMMPGMMPQMSLAKKKTFFQRFERLIKIGGSVSLITAIGVALWIWTNRDEPKSKASNIFNFMVGRAVTEANPGVFAKMKKNASFFERHFVLKNMAKMFGLDEKGMSREYKIREMRNNTARITKEIGAALDGFVAKANLNRVEKFFNGIEAVEKERKSQEVRKAALRSLGEDDSLKSALLARFRRSSSLKAAMDDIKDTDPADVVCEVQDEADRQAERIVSAAVNDGNQSVDWGINQLKKIFADKLTEIGVKKSAARSFARNWAGVFAKRVSNKLEEAHQSAKRAYEKDCLEFERAHNLQGLAKKVLSPDPLSGKDKASLDFGDDGNLAEFVARIKLERPHWKNKDVRGAIAMKLGLDDDRAEKLLEQINKLDAEGQITDVSEPEKPVAPVDKIGSYTAQWTGILERPSEELTSEEAALKGVKAEIAKLRAESRVELEKGKLECKRLKLERKLNKIKTPTTKPWWRSWWGKSTAAAPDQTSPQVGGGSSQVDALSGRVEGVASELGALIKRVDALQVNAQGPGDDSSTWDSQFTLPLPPSGSGPLESAGAGVGPMADGAGDHVSLPPRVVRLGGDEGGSGSNGGGDSDSSASSLPLPEPSDSGYDGSVGSGQGSVGPSQQAVRRIRARRKIQRALEPSSLDDWRPARSGSGTPPASSHEEVLAVA
jgi:hypothetical protein